MSLLHRIYVINDRLIKLGKDIQRKRKDKSDIKKLIGGGIRLTEDEKRKIIEFWKPYGKTDPIYQLYYYEKNGIFDERYIPDDHYYTEIQYFYNDIPAAHIVDHKCYYESLFPDVRHPKTIAMRLNGYWMINHTCVDISSVINRICEEDIVFIKQANMSCGGGGVHVLEGEKLCPEMTNQIVKGIHRDIVIQKQVKQCKEIEGINERSTNTMRIYSLIDKSGNVVILSRSLRMGVGSSRLDNAHSGGICIGFDENGDLGDFALNLRGERFYKHPTSGAVFKGMRLPNIKDIDEAVAKCALRLPAFRLVAWDFILDEDYVPTMIETNLFDEGMSVPQLNNGPLFGNRTKEFLDEVYLKNK